MPHGDADQGIRTPKSTFYDQGRFGRLFPALPGFAADTRTVRAALVELGKPGGIMDTDESPTADPFALIVDPTLSVDNPDNPRLTAGMTFLGQFLDHDMTFDPTSSLARTQDPESLRNFRIPALDLDSVYGGGPGVSPHLYDQSVDHGRTTMLVEPNAGSEAVCIDHARALRRPAQRPGHRAHRRPAQRREPHRRPAAPRVPALPQPRSSPTSGTTSARSPHPASCSPRPSGSSGGTTSG